LGLSDDLDLLARVEDLGELFKQVVVAFCFVESDLFEFVYAILLRIQTHHVETFPLRRCLSLLHVEVLSLRLHDSGSFVLQRVQGLQQVVRHLRLSVVKLTHEFLYLEH